MTISAERLPYEAKYVSTIERTDGTHCEMYELVWIENPPILVSIGVPKGRGDIAEYVAQRCRTQ